MTSSTTNTYDETFVSRHIGPRPDEIQHMLEALGYASMDEFISAAIPQDIRSDSPLNLGKPRSEAETLSTLRSIASRNRVARSFIGMGYYDCITPGVILRNILENPGWYTAYTPYQPEIAQGRLEALLNFQTMVSDLTGLEIANASLLDEGTAAAEAMAMTAGVSRAKGDIVFLIDEKCHPQTIAVVETRARARGIETRVMDAGSFEFDESVIGALVQYPDTEGRIVSYRDLCERAHEAGALVTVATDLLALTILEAPGEWGADIAVGNSQRLGVPMGYGGPHAAFFATKDKYKRNVPGRIIGVSKDATGAPALRMALQTREQHIRRDKATSNICTAQVLLAVIAGMYGVYHGPEGLRRIARRVNLMARKTAAGLKQLGYDIRHSDYFDTIVVDGEADRLDGAFKLATEQSMNLRRMEGGGIGLSMDETTTAEDIDRLFAVFAANETVDFHSDTLPEPDPSIRLERTSDYMSHPVFHRYRSETEMLRYLKRLEDRDLSLTSAMIPLGSCTMKLNATAEMEPVTWPEFGALHPFAPASQAEGYAELLQRLENQLKEITGFDSISFQPNAGSQGEFTGLLVIRAMHDDRGDTDRDVCLIPQSAHGTNPASAVMAGMRVVTVKSDDRGNIDMDDLRARIDEHRDRLGALMVTYPSTHGVFEDTIREICRLVHDAGGRVYMDGANLNAQVGLCRPADIGADVCHLNLHKTFCIPHGGGGPGMGPIGVTEELAPYLPGHPVVSGVGGSKSCGTVASAPWGSPSILPISWAYCNMMGAEGLTEATKVAILSANYLSHKLDPEYHILYSGQNGLNAHECIVDCRPFKASAGIEVEDMAKRLIDYGFHPPTISFPVPGTMMIEPTESESLQELDRFCDAMLAIRAEIKDIEDGTQDRENNVLKHAPHTLAQVISDSWDRPYSRELAGTPTPSTVEHKIWPPVARLDGAYGDRNLVCSCPPIEEYEAESTQPAGV